MMHRTKRVLSWLSVAGLGAAAMIAGACAGGTGTASFVSPTGVSPIAGPGSAANSTVLGGGVDGPLTALIRAVANCGNHGDALDVVAKVFAGVGHTQVLQVISDDGSTLTFRVGTTVFQVYYDDNGDGHFSCGDTVTGANP
jgi:hypothetical protein